MCLAARFGRVAGLKRTARLLKGLLGLTAGADGASSRPPLGADGGQSRLHLPSGRASIQTWDG